MPTNRKKIRKAVIPVAGLGTRFLPVTKTVPKELLPIVDKPILLFIFEEVMRAGIDEVILIQAREKEPTIENFFEVARELEEALARSGRQHLLKDLQKVRDHLKLTNVRQERALGLGHAILVARDRIDEDEPFAVLLGDEIILPVPGATSAIGQLCDLYRETGQSTVAVMEVADRDVSKYGIVAAEHEGDNLWRISDVIEKPDLADAPSRLALPGRYVFDPKIFDYLSVTKPGKNGEIQLTDAMVQLAKAHGMLATKVKGRRYDAGDRLGFLKANVEVALEHEELGVPFKSYLRELVRGFP